MKKWMSEFRYMMPFMVLSGPSTNSNPSQRSQALQRYSLYKSFKAMNGGQLLPMSTLVPDTRSGIQYTHHHGDEPDDPQPLQKMSNCPTRNLSTASLTYGIDICFETLVWFGDGCDCYSFAVDYWTASITLYAVRPIP